MADTPETVLLNFLSKKFDANTKWDLKHKRLHRLVGSFIYLRAKALIARQGKSAADAATEITNEILAVKNVVIERLGANNRSGALGGAQDAATPGHLDLADVAKQRITDLASPDAARAKQIQKIQKEYVLDRRRCVLAILWRAAALEFELWEDSTPAHNLKPLDVIGLKDILDRRLRAVERLHTQVGATSGRTTLESVAAAGSGWLDGMRVRLFEYPNFTLAANQRPTVQPDIPSKWVTAGNPPPNDPVTVGYAVVPPPAIRHYDGTTETQTVKTTLAWRFPVSQQASWLVSAGKNRGYRIDLVPATGTTGAGLVDSLFSFQGTANGAPEKADVWNRAWLFCDHVISAIHLESVLFGLRRLAIATNQPLASADAAFNALVALRPQLTVHKFDADNNPLRETGLVTSPFVSLDAHLHDHGVVLESYQPDPKVLMRSQQPVGTTFADPYFRNLIGGANDLQIGDRVAVFSSQAYDSISNGVWGLENSLVMDIDPDVDNPVNRGGLKMNELLLEGHGLTRAKYPDFRTSLGKGLTDEIAALKSIIFTTQKRPVHPHNESFFVEWAPYDAFKFINVNFNDPDDPNENVQPVQTGPWWVALPTKVFILRVDEDPDTVTPEQALAQVPGAIGLPDVVRYGLNGDPTIGNENARKALGLGPFSLFDKYILFPLVEPRVKSQKKKATAGTQPSPGLTWSDLFFFHNLPGGQKLENITFRMLVADQKVVPGFALTRDPLDPLDHVPMVQPRPRRV